MTEFTEALIRGIGAENVLTDELMSLHTSFRIGGPADYFIQPGSADELRKAVELCKAAEIPYFIMGNGTNLLVSDRGYRGAVIRIGRRMSDIRITGNEMFCEAGALLSAIAAAALKEELTGFEFAAGIPGSLGGACVMNAGAYGGEMKQVLKEVTCMSPDGSILTYPADELEYGYRTSRLMKESMIALSAVIALEKGAEAEIRAKMDDLKERRQTKQPLELPSAGSTFKRPEGFFAGKLIMDSGLRGYRVGGAQVSEKHCGFVVNRGGATASDVIRLVNDVRKTVYDRFGVEMELEIRTLGDI